MGGREFTLGEITVPPGEKKDIRVKISESYVGIPLFMPVTIINGFEDGPVLFITAAIHGNELVGIEIARQLRHTLEPENIKGTLILVHIANPVSFITQTRDLPDGRDLNRVFPGSPRGSIASLLAYTIFEKIVKRSDYGIDLHTAAPGRCNLPHVRADMALPDVNRLAKVFGTVVVLDNPGDSKMLRYQACKRGIPTIVYEAGEPLKFQRAFVKQGIDGVRNVMDVLGMINLERTTYPHPLVVQEHKWVRASKGGILILNVKVGEIVKKGADIAQITNPFGIEVDVIRAPYTGLVVGVTTTPMAIPGSAVCHMVRFGKKLLRFRKRLSRIFDSEEED